MAFLIRLQIYFRKSDLLKDTFLHLIRSFSFGLIQNSFSSFLEKYINNFLTNELLFISNISNNFIYKARKIDISLMDIYVNIFNEYSFRWIWFTPAYCDQFQIINFILITDMKDAKSYFFLGRKALIKICTNNLKWTTVLCCCNGNRIWMIDSNWTSCSR